MISELEKKVAGLEHIPDPSPYDHGRRPNYVDLSLNFNSIPYKSDAAIIVTAWYEQLPYMKATLTNYRKTGKFVICAYDPPFYAWGGAGTLTTCMPSYDMWLLPHAWVFKHITYDADKRNGWFWDVRYAQGIIKQFDNFKYVFHVNADCIWENPDGVDELCKMLDDADADFMTISRTPINKETPPITIHTCAVVYKTEAFHKTFDLISEKFRVPIIGSISPEGALTQAVKDLKLKELVAPIQPLEPGSEKEIDHYTRFAQNSTWKEIVGYRNLSAEHIDALVDGREPIDKKYIDIRFKRHLCTSETLLKYYETGDRRWLHMLWDQNEASWYNRVHYPLEYYGKEPILDRKSDPWLATYDPKENKWTHPEEDYKWE